MLTILFLFGTILHLEESVFGGFLIKSVMNARTICATAFAVARIVFYVRPIVVTLHLILYDSQKIQEWI